MGMINTKMAPLGSSALLRREMVVAYALTGIGAEVAAVLLGGPEAAAVVHGAAAGVGGVGCVAGVGGEAVLPPPIQAVNGLKSTTPTQKPPES